MKANPRIVKYFKLKPPCDEVASVDPSPSAVEPSCPDTQPVVGHTGEETWQDPVQKVKIQPASGCTGCTDMGGDDSVSVPMTMSKSAESAISQTMESVPGAVVSGCPGGLDPGDEPIKKEPIKWSMKRQKTASADEFRLALASVMPTGEARSSSKDRTSRTSSKSQENADVGRISSIDSASTDVPTRSSSKSSKERPVDMGKPNSELTAPEAAEVTTDAWVLNGSSPEEPQAQAAEDREEIQEIAGSEGSVAKGWCRDPMTVMMERLMPDADKNCALLFALSTFFIGAATYVMVDATLRIGIILKAPPLFMGLIFLAAGTSIPDAMGSISVAKQGEGDMAVANSLGSNVFDILIGLGVPWTLRNFMGYKVEFIGKFELLAGDLSILAVVLLILILSLVLNRWRLSKKLGAILLSFYGFYIVYNIAAVWLFKFKSQEG